MSDTLIYFHSFKRHLINRQEKGEQGPWPSFIIAFKAGILILGKNNKKILKVL